MPEVMKKSIEYSLLEHEVSDNQVSCKTSGFTCMLDIPGNPGGLMGVSVLCSGRHTDLVHCVGMMSFTQVVGVAVVGIVRS